MALVGRSPRRSRHGNLRGFGDFGGIYPPDSRPASRSPAAKHTRGEKTPETPITSCRWPRRSAACWIGEVPGSFRPPWCIQWDGRPWHWPASAPGGTIPGSRRVSGVLGVSRRRCVLVPPRSGGGHERLSRRVFEAGVMRPRGRLTHPTARRAGGRGRGKRPIVATSPPNKPNKPNTLNTFSVRKRSLTTAMPSSP